VINAWA